VNLDIFVLIIELLQSPIIYIQNQKNAIMIRTKILGISIILNLVFFFTSCHTVSSIQKHAVVLEEFDKYYIHDSLSFSYSFPGDYIQINNQKEIRNNIRKINKTLPFKHCIAYFKTKIPPDFVHCTFYFPNKKQITHHKLLQSIKRDTADFFIDTNQCIAGKFISLENQRGFVCIVAHSNKNDFFLLKPEYADIFNHIVTDEKYRDITFRSPFDVGKYKEVSEDTTVNYLMPVYNLKYYEPNYTDNVSKWLWKQAYLTYATRLTNTYFNTRKTDNELYNMGFVANSENVLADNETALSYLIQKCKDERVVMINENHFFPHTRILAEILLDSLYNCGFKYLGMEAIVENDTVLNNRGFAVTHTGFYSREPIMANFIRKAIEKGYYVFGYDDYSHDREKNQAFNIYQKTVAKDSLCKVLVWAGHGHINEAERDRIYMAREFFLLTGINPLTINQTDYLTEDNKYFIVLDTASLKNRVNACDIFAVNNIDYELFATKSNYKDYNITIPEYIVKQSQTDPLMFIISVFVADEYQHDKTAIPVYNYVLNNDLHNISIKLPDNNYLYVIRNRYGMIVTQRNL
jgi:hypothetical protein